jgi:hypothetical protein
MPSRLSVSLLYHVLNKNKTVVTTIHVALAKSLSFPTRRSIGFRDACTQVSCTELSRGPQASRPIISASGCRVRVLWLEWELG